MTDRAEMARKLFGAATLLLQNAEGCAQNHHGQDFATMGEPGWLRDVRSDIEAAATLPDLLEPQYTDEALREILAQVVGNRRVRNGESGLYPPENLTPLSNIIRWGKDGLVSVSEAIAAMRRLLHQDIGAAEAMREAAAKVASEHRPPPLRMGAHDPEMLDLIECERRGEGIAGVEIAKAIRALPLPQPPVSDNTKEKV